MAGTLGATPQQLAAAKKLVTGSSVGAAVEGFDVIVKAARAVVMAENFYAESEGTTGLLPTFATVSVSYVLDRVAGRKGSKVGPAPILILLTVGTLIMAVAPAYAQAGARSASGSPIGSGHRARR